MSTDLRQNQLKYGQIDTNKCSTRVPMGASEAIVAQSGRFVTLDSNGRGEISGAASTTVHGWVELGAQTTSSTEGGTKANCNTSAEAKFRVPVNSGTFVEAMVGKTCDLSVSSTIQGAALDASTRDIVIIVDGDKVGNKYVDVKMVAAKQIKSGVV